MPTIRRAYRHFRRPLPAVGEAFLAAHAPASPSQRMGVIWRADATVRTLAILQPNRRDGKDGRDQPPRGGSARKRSIAEVGQIFEAYESVRRDSAHPNVKSDIRILGRSRNIEPRGWLPMQSTLTRSTFASAWRRRPRVRPLRIRRWWISTKRPSGNRWRWRSRRIAGLVEPRGPYRA